MQIITLSSDVGQQDFIIPAIKGKLLSHLNNATIVDVSHYLSQSNLPEAAYLCSNAFIHFPPKTIHLIILNFFETNKPHVLLVEHNNQIIICADNGMITMLLEQKPEKVYALPINNNLPFMEIMASVTLAIGALGNGKKITEIATPIDEIVIKYPLKPTASDNWIKGQIIFIDNFENVVVNITKAFFEEMRKNRSFKIIVKRETIVTLQNSYYYVPEGEKMAWFNSAGYLEIAINKGNMAGMFGLQGFNEIMYKEGKAMQNKWFYESITILFE